MLNVYSRDVLSRCGDNPLISINDMPFRCSDVWNAGIAHCGDEFVMLITVEELEGTHSIYRAVSPDGLRFTVDAWPVMVGEKEGFYAQYESAGVRDARVTQLEGRFYVTYAAEGDHGVRVGLAQTDDFTTIKRLGYVSQVDAKNGVLMPEKIAGRYAMLTRPDAGASIWLQFSDDLEFWGDYRCVMTPRGGFWDSTRIGLAGTPVKIEQGWLVIYYGEKHTSAGPLVRLGAAILDEKNPSKVVGRSNIPLISPRERYERIGDIPNVIFSCGYLVEDGLVKIYYGASDSCICLASASLEDVVQTCFESKRSF